MLGAFLGGAGLAVLLVSGGSLLIMESGRMAARFARISTLDSAMVDGGGCATERPDSEETRSLRRSMMENGLTVETDYSVEQIVRISQWIGNTVKHAGPHAVTHGGHQLLQLGASGVPLSCGAMAQILHDALSAVGCRTRTVQLVSGLFWPHDTHVLIEAYIGNRWIAFDPTFHVTYQSEGRILNVSEIASLIRNNKAPAVQAVWHGEREYGVRIEDYYLDWHLLFSNAYVECGTKTFIGAVPPLRWWLGPVRYFFGDRPAFVLRNHNRLYFVFCVVLPFAGLVGLAGGGGLLVVAARKSKTGQRKHGCASAESSPGV